MLLRALFSFAVCTLLIVGAGNARAGNTTAQEYGDAAYRYLNFVGWFGYNYNHTGIFSGLRQSDGVPQAMEAVNFFTTTREADFAEITTNNGDYYGAYTLSNLSLSFTGRKAIVSTAKQLADAAIPYTVANALDYKGGSFNGTVSDIDNIRCDGFVEYTYEKNGIQVWRNTTDPSGEWSIVSFPDNHNDAPDLTVNPNRELSPWAQRGAPASGGPRYGGSNPNNTYLTLDAVIALPVYELTQVAGPGYVDVTIRASDTSGIHQIGYRRPGDSGWQYSPRQPQHPTSDSYAYTVRVTTEGYLDYYAQDNGGNFPPGAEAVYISPPLAVEIDVHPSDPANEVHPEHDGSPSAINGLNDVIPVIVFGSSTAFGDPVDFAAEQIVPATVTFGPAEGAIDPASTPVLDEDVDSDGLLDAQFDFLTGDTGFACTDTEATIQS
jgi:hypothetical protein